MSWNVNSGPQKEIQETYNHLLRHYLMKQMVEEGSGDRRRFVYSNARPANRRKVSQHVALEKNSPEPEAPRQSMPRHAGRPQKKTSFQVPKGSAESSQNFTKEQLRLAIRSLEQGEQGSISNSAQLAAE